MKIQFQNSSITIFESALFQTTSTVIVHPNFILIVDPNWLPREIEFIQNHVNNIRQAQPIYLLFTHSDYDHIIGYRAFPNAKIIASANFKNQSKKEDILNQIRKFDDENYIARSYPIEYPEVDIVISEDDKKVEIENVEFIFHQAVGHNDDGIFTWIPSLGVFIVGDYLCEVEFPFIYVSGLEYLKTLEKAEQVIEKLNPSILIVGHGMFSKNKNEMLQRVADAKKYINDLIFSIKKNTPFDLDLFLGKYKYPNGMRESHKNNLAIIRKEIESTEDS